MSFERECKTVYRSEGTGRWALSAGRRAEDKGCRGEKSYSYSYH